MIKTFRGILDDGAQKKVRLSTKKGKIGYRIVKFEIYPNKPGQESVENNIAIWKVKQSSVSTSVFTVDFSDANMLAVASYHDSSSESTTSDFVTIFDREIFNQDVFITHTDTNSNIPCNYYLELETINMTDNATAVSTLRDIRLNPEPI